ncbi:Pyruvate dehydrogenase complex repressor [bioreactor metagenome]|uniref:Pyruvate dehydrogenase complex repressor n=1 Tax=bioreactor metagenome TaxID=1076179 RepID=A0A645H7S9_9ZZZZ
MAELKYIKGEIVNGSWKPGDKIPSENMLCKTLSVSRVSVRAALKKLTSVGLIESFQGKGTFVCKEGNRVPLNDLYSVMVLNQSDRMSLLEFRKIFEVACAGYAAIRATTEMVDSMNETVMNLEAAQTPEDIIQYGLMFHHQLALATNNSIMIRTFEVMQDSYLHIFRENVSLLGTIGVEDHRNILSAIETRDVELAKKLMDEHLNNTTKKMVDARNNNTQ